MTKLGSIDVANHPVVSRQEWLAARTALLAREKEYLRLGDALARERRALPWVSTEKPYAFDGPDGRETLPQLFQGRSQLFVYHFMFNPESTEGCKHCSFWADHFDGAQVHLRHRDVTMAVISRAPWSRIEAFRKRMGWNFKWLSSAGSDFNYDFHVSFTPEAIRSGALVYNYETVAMDMADREGLSVFYRDGNGSVFHTYSSYARGIETLNGTYHVLDLVPKGRDEDGLESPQDWVRFHDRYRD